MKRLAFLTLLMVPCAIAAIEAQSPCASRYHPAIAPRVGRLEAQNPVDDDADDDELSAPRAEVQPASRIEVQGFLMATPERAREDARRVLDKVLARWLEPSGVPADWRAPEDLIHQMVQAGPVEELHKDYGTVYVQTLYLDHSARQRNRLIGAYEHDVAGRHLVQLVGVLAFVLACLGALVAYIRVDEETKGYYTTHLRLAAAAGVGAAGVALYRLLT